MAFGKRAAGQTPPPPMPPTGDDESDFDQGVAGVRARVANPGGMDHKFIGLAIAVVVVSAGGAIAAPSLLSMMGGTPVRPIEQVIAGLDRPAMRAALAHEAFPDESGRAFMTTLATHFPQQHGRLLDQLADTATAGGDRDDLFLTMNAWSMDFAPQQMNALGRTGAEGFDATLKVVSEGLKVIEADAGGCTLKTLEQYIMNPSNFASLTSYGSEGYRVSMRANAKLIDLVVKGRDAQPINTTLTLDDESALRTTFLSMLNDPQVMNLVQSGISAGPNMQADLAQTVNVCQLARTVMIKLESLPAGTKSRLFATALSGDFNSLDGGLGNPFGPGAFQGMQPSLGGTQFFP